MYGIKIDDGKKIKCPNCNSVFAIENENEILYRNVTLLYFNTKEGTGKIKCKQCKIIASIELLEHGGKVIVVE